MKTLTALFMLAGLLLAFNAQAVEKYNRVQKICDHFYPPVPADYAGATITTPKADEVPMCWWNSSGIGSQALIDYLENPQSTPMAIEAYWQSKGQTQSCYGGLLIAGKIDERTVSLCYFSDGSVISYITLVKGALHPENATLTTALKGNQH